MEISERKLAANRANAEKSTGPRSPLGKIISSANSSRHRILAASVVLDNESPKRFIALLNSFNAHYRPQDPIERSLVERMAVSHWRLMRIWALETAGIHFEKRRQPESILKQDAPTRTMAAIRALSDSERHPDPIGRKESRYNREFYLAFDALNRHRDRIRGPQNRNEPTHVPDSKQRARSVEPIVPVIEPISEAAEPISEPVEPKPSGPLCV
jgi:hypothetical protein